MPKIVDEIREWRKLRRAERMLREFVILETVRDNPGITTQDLIWKAEDRLWEMGIDPSWVGGITPGAIAKLSRQDLI